MFFVGDSAGHCFPLSGEGIRTAFYFGDRRAGASCAPWSTAARTHASEALARYGAFRDAPRGGVPRGRCAPARDPRAAAARC